MHEWLALIGCILGLVVAAAALMWMLDPLVGIGISGVRPGQKLRSRLESKLLRLFREAQLAPRSVPIPGSQKLTPPFGVVGDDLERLVRGTPEDSLRFLMGSVITYIESDAYGSAGIPETN